MISPMSKVFAVGFGEALFGKRSSPKETKKEQNYDNETNYPLS